MLCLESFHKSLILKIADNTVASTGVAYVCRIVIDRIVRHDTQTKARVVWHEVNHLTIDISVVGTGRSVESFFVGRGHIVAEHDKDNLVGRTECYIGLIPHIGDFFHIVADNQRLEVFATFKCAHLYTRGGTRQNKSLERIESPEHKEGNLVIVLNIVVVPGSPVSAGSISFEVCTVVLVLASRLKFGLVEIEVLEMSRSRFIIIYVAAAQVTYHTNVATINRTNDTQRVELRVIAIQMVVCKYRRGIFIGKAKFFCKCTRFGKFYNFQSLARAETIDVVSNGSPLRAISFNHTVGYIYYIGRIKACESFCNIDVGGHGALHEEFLDAATGEGVLLN